MSDRHPRESNHNGSQHGDQHHNDTDKFVTRDELHAHLEGYIHIRDIQDMVVTLSRMDESLRASIKEIRQPVIEGVGGRDPHIIAVPSTVDKVNHIVNRLDIENRADARGAAAGSPADKVSMGIAVSNFISSNKWSSLFKIALFSIILYFFLLQNGCNKLIDTSVIVIERTAGKLVQTDTTATRFVLIDTTKVNIPMDSIKNAVVPATTAR